MKDSYVRYLNKTASFLYLTKKQQQQQQQNKKRKKKIKKKDI